MTTTEVLKLEIAKLDLKDGDVLVVRVATKLTRESHDMIREVLKHAFPGRKSLVVDPGTEFMVLRHADPSDPLARDKRLLKPEGSS